MKIDIVTPYGNNKFDLGVNEVTALIQKAYEYSERKSEEGSEQKGGADTLQEVVAEAWGVASDKERGVGLDKEYWETADMGVQKPQKRSRNDNLFGEGWKETLHNGYIQKDYSESAEGYKGFLYIKCPVCGREKGFCAKNGITDYECECGHKTHLEDLKPMYVHCDCGKNFKYLTNMDQDTFNYKCINCGDIVKIRINKRGTAYTTDMKNLGGGAWEKIWNEYREIWRFVLKSADRIDAT